ncbi:MAG: hypothetical protein AAGH15_01575 [Myxococcota bacterium]
MALLALLGACGEDAGARGGLELQLETDLIPGVELRTVEVFAASADGVLAGAALEERTLEASEDWTTPRRLMRLAPGVLGTATHVALVGRNLAGTRPLTVRRPVSESGAPVLFRLTRSCRGVFCDGTETCLGGRCVPLACARGDEVSCPEPACTIDDDCLPASPGCGTRPRCDAGVCFVSVDSTPCPVAHYCELGEGCEALPGMGASNGDACVGASACASGICLEGQCCERACGPCETCVGGRCSVRPGASAEPGAEICDGLDNDCDLETDEEVVTADEDDCGACRFACASNERCDGLRCVDDAVCERSFGRPCADLQVAKLRAPVPHDAAFGATLAASGELLAVGAPDDGIVLAGIDHVPTEDARPQAGVTGGAVHVFHREGERWRLEATMRLPDLEVRFDYRTANYGRLVAVSNDRLAAVGDGLVGRDVHVYTRDADGRWTGPEVARGSSFVMDVGFLGDGRLVILRRTSLEVEEAVGPGPITIGQTVSFNLTTHVAIDGENLVVAWQTGVNLSFGTLEGGFTRLTDLTQIVRDVVLDGAQIHAINGGLGGFPPLLTISPDGMEWETRLTTGLPERDWRALAAMGDWIAVGAPRDPLADAPLVGADTRFRPDRRGDQGSVYLYPRSDAGVPFDRPLYLRPAEARPGAEFGASLATDGQRLFVGAPSDATGGAADPDGDAIPRAGSVTIWRLAP